MTYSLCKLIRLIGVVWAFQRIQLVQSADKILYTYYDANDEELNHYDDDLELLEYWQQSWQAVGWETVILNASHIANKIDTVVMQSSERQLHSSFNKWMAMATRGGYYCLYDVLPLNTQEIQDSAVPFQYNTNSTTPLPDQLVVYEVIAPTCMSGSKHAWQEMAKAFYEHSLQEPYFWTDALALVDLRDRVSFQRGVLQLDDSLMFFNSQHRHGQQQDPCHNLQKHVQRKRKWAVQFSPATLQRSRYMPKEWKYPQHRLHVAKQWFQEYKNKCIIDVEKK